MGFGGGSGGLLGLGRTHLLLNAVVRLHVKEGTQIGEVKEGQDPQRPIERLHPQGLQMGGGRNKLGGGGGLGLPISKPRPPPLNPTHKFKPFPHPLSPAHPLSPTRTHLYR